MQPVLLMSIRRHCNTLNIQMYSQSETVHQRQTPKQWQPSVIYIHDLDLDFITFAYVCVCVCECGGVQLNSPSFMAFYFLLWLSLYLAGQVGVLHKNIKKYLSGQSLDANYDGYASCPLVTGYDTCIMAEFDYNLQPKETFPFRQDCERYSMYVLKRDFMPLLYWHLMLNGHWNGPEPMRKIFSLFKRS